ncbi:MAG: valine--tRNA ligase [Methylococcales bacterium]
MDKTYDPHAIETRWYAYWEEKGYFVPQGQGDAFCIMIPPPNVTGSLHMGHAFQDTIMDALTRYHRMKGDQALWQPGTDHAGIATQMVVERQLNEQGLKRHDLGRDQFIERVWEWKQESGNTITRQLRRMGASPDWSRERFTMDEGMSKAVHEVFVKLYDEGLIYRGKRLVNWDPVLHTAVSDLEVIQEETRGHLWHMRYPLADGSGNMIVATTRPETMLGDTAVAVHPDDQRYQQFIGKTIKLPLTEREIPIIADQYVDQEFGSGCVKITPAHDFNDHDIGKRHDLPVLNIFNADASINDNAPEQYQGMDRFVARKQIIADLEALGLLEKTEDHSLVIPKGDRTGAVIEPLLTDQWFVKVETLAKPAIEAVESGRIRFVPDNWKNTYFEWMRNIEDWCISRQIWWGHRIPAWYDEDGHIYVGHSEQEVREKHNIPPSTDLQQDEDVLDTWFSSALWPFSTLGWPDNTDALKTFYPTSVLVTGFDIIFFWVARMIMMGLKFMGDVPFHEIYMTGLIRDSAGQKMSKSKGNVLDPLDFIDGISLDDLIKKRTTGLMQPEMKPKVERDTIKEFPEGIASFGTDALRFTFSSLASNGRDIRFDMGRIEGYRNFCNKLWNAARYVLMNTDGYDTGLGSEQRSYSLPDRWIQSRLQQTTKNVTESINSYRFDLASQAIYDFIWNEYCDWYLELSKIVLQQNDEIAARGTRQTLVSVLESALRLLHPLMPFITEEIWQKIAPLAGITSKTIMLQPFPNVHDSAIDAKAESEMDWLMKFVLGVRRIRGEINIPPGKALPVLLQGGSTQDRQIFDNNTALIQRMARLETVQWLEAEQSAPEAAIALVGDLKILVPMAGLIDKQAELDRLSKEISKIEANLPRIEGKLNNPKFVDKAPATVIEKERTKLAGFRSQLEKLLEQKAKIELIEERA